MDKPMIKILSMLSFGIRPIIAYANVSGDYEYTVTGGTATITKYLGQGGDITIPSTIDGYTVISIGFYAFWANDNVTSVIIPNSVTSIDHEAFTGCSNLTSVTIPNSVTSIGYLAFYDCESLMSVTIPSSVYSIGNLVFGYCSKLTSINVDVGNLNYSSFDGVLYDKLQNNLICYPGGKTGPFVIPNSVTSINDFAFVGCTLLTSVTIPNSVINIGVAAFRDCKGLTSVSIPNSVINIGAGGFANCISLTSVTISNGVASIGSQAFAGCTSLTGVTIPNSVTSIGDLAFAYCSKLTSINVDIGNLNYSSSDGVLYNKLQTTLISYPSGRTGSFVIPNTVINVGHEAFYYCTSLTSVTIPNSVTTIGHSAFENCESLTNVSIPNSVTSIDYSAFIDCDNLTSVTISSSVTSIGDVAFAFCSKLISISVDIGNLNYSSSDGILYDKLQNNLICYPGGKTGPFVIPNTVTTIVDYAFANCLSLTSITIPNSVTSIGESAFYNCDSLTSVTIPNSVTIIDNRAFEDCSNLTEANFFGDAPQIFVDIFLYHNPNLKVFYLAGKTGYDTEYWQFYNATPFYIIAYDGNNSTSGTVPEDNNTYLEGDTVTVLANTGSLAKTGFVFAGWTTSANGNGTVYVAGNTFTMGTTHVTLYAKWDTPEESIQRTIEQIPILIPDNINNSYITKLNNVSKSLDNGNTTSALQQLQAFINHVNSQYNKKKLTEDAYNYLISQANSMIEAINGH